ncbi:hypothetical protein QC589_01650 [Halomonas elongata]|uniref:hypothetical protein n=1 Tax=Halomonas elongata TaxID=2746 RepID=UPI0033574789
MRMTKPQQRLIAALRQRKQLVYHLHGGGWRLFDGTPVHHRTVESLADHGLLIPAANDLFDDQPAAYRLPG